MGNSSATNQVGAQLRTILDKIKLAEALANFDTTNSNRGDLVNQQIQMMKNLRDLENDVRTFVETMPAAEASATQGGEEKSPFEMLSRFIESSVHDEMKSAWDPDSFTGSLIVLIENGAIQCSSLLEKETGLRFEGVPSEATDKQEKLVADQRPIPFTTLRSRTGRGYNFYFELKQPGEVLINIYDKENYLVRRMLKFYSAAGEYTVDWDGRDESGKPLPRALYYCRLQIDNLSSERKSLELQ